MKLVAALVASAFAVTAFAADVNKKDHKDGAKPAAAAAAPAPAKDAKAAPAKSADKKAEAAKK